MLGSFSALQYLLIVFAGWVNRQQLDVIDYLEQENRVLREMLGAQRLHFTDAQRRRLAEKAKRLGRKVLNDVVGYPQVWVRSRSWLLRLLMRPTFRRDQKRLDFMSRHRDRRAPKDYSILSHILVVTN